MEILHFKFHLVKLRKFFVEKRRNQHCHSNFLDFFFCLVCSQKINFLSGHSQQKVEQTCPEKQLCCCNINYDVASSRLFVTLFWICFRVSGRSNAFVVRNLMRCINYIPGENKTRISNISRIKDALTDILRFCLDPKGIFAQHLSELHRPGENSLSSGFVYLVTSLPLKRARNSIGADRGSGLTRLAFPPMDAPPLPAINQVRTKVNPHGKCHPSPNL